VKSSRWLPIAAALVCWVSTAEAKPSIWARAANPELAQEADAIDTADRAVSRDYSLGRMSTAARRRILLRKTLVSLRRVTADKSKNMKLRYRLAQVHYRLFDVERDLKHIERATKHFELISSSEEVPRSQRARALMSLAICYARLGRHGDEIVAYSKAIALQADPISHSVLLANQAEGFMARGHIIAAVRGYRASLRATPSPLMIDSGVTTMWGLAVALDRSGDLNGALANVRRARSYDPGDLRINGDHWFYVPSYDRHWYEALGHWQIARDAKNPDVKRQAYDAAIASWQAFTNQADAKDPWVAIAAFRTTQCEAERNKAMERIELQRVKELKRAKEIKRRPPTAKDLTLWPDP
jgi:tetratricopeptide (TPR) repeat protein